MTPKEVQDAIAKYGNMTTEEFIAMTMAKSRQRGELRHADPEPPPITESPESVSRHTNEMQRSGFIPYE